MESNVVKYVYEHPPRCIAGLRPRATAHSKPTLRLPRHLSIYHEGYGETNTASFVVGCPCGNRAVYLLGYYITTGGSRRDTGFVGPLSLGCPECGRVSEFFDTRKHGYDGEQGVNTYVIGQGEPDKFACPHCGASPMFLNPTFSYQGVEDLPADMHQRLQDFFGGFDILGQCTRCNALVEITSFECA